MERIMYKGHAIVVVGLSHYITRPGQIPYYPAVFPAWERADSMAHAKRLINGAK